MSKRTALSFAIAAALGATAASAQLLGGGSGGLLGGSPAGGGALGGLGQTVGGIGNSVDRRLDAITGSPAATQQAIAPTLDRVSPLLEVVESAPSRLADFRRMRLEALIRANRDTLDRDSDGQPVRKGELVVTDPDARSLALASAAGFRVLRDEQAGELGLRIVTLSVPQGMNVRDGRKRLARIAPTLDADYNHIFEPAGGALATASGATLAASSPFRPGTRVAMIDGGVASHSSMARAAIEQRGFAGPAQPTGHGTAVGSLLVGNQGVFRGAASGAQLFVGDVYGGNPAAGSASVIVKALAWAAGKRPEVVNISLVGPANRVLARAVAALQSRGISVVAAVGNDGPAAPPQYPASYPGVIAVTGVDASNRALREAGRSAHLDFAAPGADLVAALPGQGFTEVRGTSFAAPLVAARLAAARSPASLAREAVPGKGKVGRGIVCAACRVEPKAVGLK